MPRRVAGSPEDRFLRANLNDPDNQAALLRAYLELKQTAADLSEKLARADDRLVARETAKAEEARQAQDAGQAELAQKSARLERMGEAMRLVRWAGEWAARGATFLVGTRHDLGQLVGVATASVDSCQQVRYDKAADAWTLAWGDGRPDTLIAVAGAKSGEPPSPAARRRRTVHSGH